MLVIFIDSASSSTMFTSHSGLYMGLQVPLWAIKCLTTLGLHVRGDVHIEAWHPLQFDVF